MIVPLGLVATGAAFAVGGCDRVGPEFEIRNTHHTQIDLYTGARHYYGTMRPGESYSYSIIYFGDDELFTYKAYEVVSPDRLVSPRGIDSPRRRVKAPMVRGELVYCIRTSVRQILDDGGVMIITRNVPPGIFDEQVDPCPETAVENGG